GGHRAFDADVVSARSAAADAHAATAPRLAVISRAPRHCVIKIRRIQYLFRAQRLETFGPQPGVKHLNNARSQQGGLHHTSVEEDVRRAGKATRAAPEC